ncbi:chorismate dehydratase [bacterium BMS3Abin13]|nr:chorismate dehydratase [bacterium BMS3Abin13]
MARIGMVNYINTAPIYEVWKATINRPDWQVTEAPPSVLNRLLAADELDLGFVSSYEYAARPAKYRILADLSISATGPVGSVFLFSTVAPAELTGRLVLLTGQSDTSIRLVRIILEEFFHVRPEYVVGEISGRREADRKIDAVLAIGDEALRIKLENRYPVQIDLAGFWHQTTGLPFVFSVCAIREDFVRSEPETALAIRDALLRCRAAGLEQLAEICDQVAKRIPMDPAACCRYLQGIEYDLGPTKQQALEKFFTYLISRNEADEQALPLKIFPQDP